RARRIGANIMLIDSDKRGQFLTNIALAGLVFAPYVISALLKTFLNPRPYWYFSYDPEIWWYFGGLGLADGGKPFVVTHPGGPLYLLTAIISKTGSFGPLDFSKFRTVGYIAALPINFIGCWLVISALRLRPLWTRLVAGLLVFLTPQIFEYNNVWSAELFFPAVAGACVAALFLMPQGQDIKLVALGSILVGISASHKLNFAAIGLAYALSVVVVTSYFNSAAMAVKRGSVSLLFQLLGFLIGTAPLFTNLPDIFQRTFDVIVRQGHLGEGEFGMPPATDIFNAIAIYVAG